MNKFKAIAFIGGGNMAEALVKGILAAGHPAARIVVSEPVTERRQLLKARFGVAVTADNAAAVAGAEIVVLAVKPQMAAEVVRGFASAFTPDKLLVSILAGTTTTALAGWLGDAARVVRVMPNTPALVGMGAAALCAGGRASAEDLATARGLFEAVGITVLVAEEQMDAVTALSGSGPAYVFSVIEGLTAGGVAEGLDRATALALAVQTVAGAARLVAETGEDPAELRRKVCSPGGTTLAAIERMSELGFSEALVAGVRRAAERSRELGRK